jgi:putative sterol carrier protein
METSWKVDAAQPLNETLRDAILDKIDEGTLALPDLKDYFTVFTQLCNLTEDIQDEVEKFDRTFLFKIDGKPSARLIIRGGKFETDSADVADTDITLEMSEELTLGVLSGRVDPTAAYMSGDLRVDGLINDAIRFRTILDLVLEELE